MLYGTGNRGIHRKGVLISEKASGEHQKINCGIISERGEKQIGIISNDKGFQAVIDFFCVNRDAAKPQVVKAGNIETAFTLFN